jgi:maltose/moltooligosaccharide transporter
VTPPVSRPVRSTSAPVAPALVAACASLPTAWRIGAQPEELPLLNLAGPVTGLVIQPLIGAMSDNTWSPRWGRRKPYFLIGALGCTIMLFLFPFVGALWVAFLFMWLLDASNNTAMEPYRAFISDRLPKNQLARGFLTQALFVGMGAVGANLSILVFQRTIDGVTDNGIPYWVYVAFWIGAVCSIGSVLVSVLSTKEIPPTDEELEELRAKPKGVGPFFKEIADAVRDMPAGMHKTAWSSSSSGSRWRCTGSSCR